MTLYVRIVRLSSSFISKIMLGRFSNTKSCKSPDGHQLEPIGFVTVSVTLARILSKISSEVQVNSTD